MCTFKKPALCACLALLSQVTKPLSLSTLPVCLYNADTVCFLWDSNEIFTAHTWISVLKTVTWFQDRSIYFSQRRRFSPSSALSPVSVLPPMLHIHLHLDAIIRTSGRNLGKFKQCNAPLDIVRVDSSTSNFTMSILRGLIRGEHHRMLHGWRQDGAHIGLQSNINLLLYSFINWCHPVVLYKYSGILVSL
jgi:hypothetical protein